MLTRRALLVGGGFGVGALAGWVARGAGAEGAPPLRPPGARVGDDRFLAACIRCAQCIRVCPASSLYLGTEPGAGLGAPELRPRETPCTLCAGEEELLCIATCPSGALQPVDDPRQIRIGTAVLDTELCLAYHGAMCRACWHACPFPYEALCYDERLRPFVDTEVCVGCGLCERACPTDPRAIEIVPREDAKRVPR